MSNYNERDIKAIISRAAELQQRSKSQYPENKDKSLSLEEVEEIAREVGVSIAFVREAALEYEGIPVEEPLLLDTGNSHDAEVVGLVRGELNKKTWAELRSIIEYEFDAPGKVRRRPNGIIWEAQPKGISKNLKTRNSPRVEIRHGRGRSTIRIKKNLKTYDKLLYPAFVAWAAAVFLTTLLVIEEAPPPIFLLAAVSAGVGELFRRWKNRKKNQEKQRLKDIMEQLQTIFARRTRANSEITSANNNQGNILDQESDNDYIKDDLDSSRSPRKKERT